MTTAITLYEVFDPVLGRPTHLWSRSFPTVSNDGNLLTTPDNYTTIEDVIVLNAFIEVNSDTNLDLTQLNLVDTGAGLITLTLPDYTQPGREGAFYFVQISTGTGQCRIRPASGQLVDGVADAVTTLTFVGNSAIFYCAPNAIAAGTGWTTDTNAVGKTSGETSSIITTTNQVVYGGNLTIDGRQNRLINLAPGTSPTDAATLGQLTLTQFNHVVMVSPTATYTSVGAALAAVAAAMPNQYNTFLIKIGPGAYEENPLQMLSYVYLEGAGEALTTLGCGTPGIPFILGAHSSSISKMYITSANIAGSVGIQYNNGSTAASPMYIRNIQFGLNATQIQSHSSAFTTIIIDSCTFGGADYFDIGIDIANSDPYNPTYVHINNCEYLTASTTNIPTNMIRLSGIGVVVAVTNSIFVNAIDQPLNSGKIGCLIQDGAEARVTGVTMRGWENSFWAKPGTGFSGPKLTIDGSFIDSTHYNLFIEDVGTVGNLAGYTDYSKNYIAAGSQFFIVGKNPLVITVGETGADFTSIADAANSITDATVNKRYEIRVSPGIYTEPQIDLSSKSYVSITGDNIMNVTVQPVASYPTQLYLFKLGAINEISFLNIQNTGVGQYAVYVNDGGDYSQMHKVSFLNCHIGTYITCNSVLTNTYIEYVDYNGDFLHAVKIEATGNSKLFVNMENFYVLPGSTVYDTIGAYIVNTNTWTGVPDSGVEVKFLTSGFIGFSQNNVGLMCENGVDVTVVSTYFNYWNIAITDSSSGIGVDIDMVGCNVIDNGTDLTISNADTVGGISGIFNVTKVSRNPANTTFAWLFLDEATGAIEITNVLNMTYPGNTHTDISTLITESGTMGVLSGGNITLPSPGLTVNISAGYGYIDSNTLNNIKKITWAAQTYTAAASTSAGLDHYLYFDFTGSLQSSTNLPDTRYSILLGRIVVDDTEIVLIDTSNLMSHHNANLQDTYNRSAFGPVFASGCITTENISTAFHLNVSSGLYYLSTDKFTPSGGANITFQLMYRGVAGVGWVRISTNTVPILYDSGTGTPTAVPSSRYLKHSLYVVGDDLDERYFLVMAQTTYATLIEVEAAPLPNPPGYFHDAVCLIATIIVQDTAIMITEIQDARPVIGFKATGVSASAIHGNLLELLADDHPQYLLVDGTRPMAGALDLNSNNIVSAGTMNGVSIQSHGSRHNPNGTDPISVGAPFSIGTANVIGTANSVSRSDHIHSHGDQTGPTLHAAATATSNGFMTGSQFTQVAVATDHVTNVTRDDHSQYVRGLGRAGGQSIYGGTDAGASLTLASTTNSTKGAVVIADSTAAIALNTGSFQVTGGASVAGAMYIGGVVSVAGTINTTAGTTMTLAAASGDIILAPATSGGRVEITANDDSTGVIGAGNGALQVVGGAIIGKSMTVLSATNTTGTSTGALRIPNGGVSVGQDAWVGGMVTVPTLTGGSNTGNSITIRPNSNTVTNGQVNFVGTLDASLLGTAAAAFSGGVSIAKTVLIGGITGNNTGITITAVSGSPGTITMQAASQPLLLTTSGTGLVQLGRDLNLAGHVLTDTVGTAPSDAATNGYNCLTIQPASIPLVNANIQLAPTGAGDVLLTKPPTLMLAAVPKSYVGWGNLMRVDPVYGDDTLAASYHGHPFQTIPGALANITGVAFAGTFVISLAAATYTLSAGIGIPAGVGLIGVDRDRVILSATPTTNMTLVSFSTSGGCRLENLTINVSTSTASTDITAVLFPTTSNPDASVINNCNIVAVGTRNTIGVAITGSVAHGDDYFWLRNSRIAVSGSGTSANAVLVSGTNLITVSIKSCECSANGTATTVFGVASTNTNTSTRVFLENCFVQGGTSTSNAGNVADVSVDSAGNSGIVIANTKLRNITANLRGLVLVNPIVIQFALSNTIANASNLYLFMGTTTGAVSSLNNFPIYSFTTNRLVTKLSYRFASAPNAGGSCNINLVTVDTTTIPAVWASTVVLANSTAITSTSTINTTVSSTNKSYTLTAGTSYAIQVARNGASNISNMNQLQVWMEIY